MQGLAAITARILRCLGAAFMFAALTACVSFPDVPSQRPVSEDAEYPRLLPLDELLVGPEPRATVAVIGNMQSRVDALRAKSVRLQGPVIEPALRSRMERGVR